jgi:hypothetical protein
MVGTPAPQARKVRPDIPVILTSACSEDRIKDVMREERREATFRRVLQFAVLQFADAARPTLQ